MGGRRASGRPAHEGTVACLMSDLDMKYDLPARPALDSHTSPRGEGLRIGLGRCGSRAVLLACDRSPVEAGGWASWACCLSVRTVALTSSRGQATLVAACLTQGPRLSVATPRLGAAAVRGRQGAAATM